MIGYVRAWKLIKMHVQIENRQGHGKIDKARWEIDRAIWTVPSAKVYTMSSTFAL